VRAFISALPEILVIHNHRGVHDVKMVGEQLYQILTDIKDGYFASGTGTQPF
jgi:hypothetical protein